jgi:hypothetical protein
VPRSHTHTHTHTHTAGILTRVMHVLLWTFWFLIWYGWKVVKGLCVFMLVRVCVRVSDATHARRERRKLCFATHGFI